jgi:nucleoid-associated protein YgaU
MASYGAVAVWAPSVPGARVEPVRLTRRGRLMRTLALSVLLAALAVVAVDRATGEPARAGSGATPAVATATVVVEQGDSLWAIAQRVRPGTDPREIVVEIRELNGMRSNLIQPGQVLLVPSRG